MDDTQNFFTAMCETQGGGLSRLLGNSRFIRPSMGYLNHDAMDRTKSYATGESRKKTSPLIFTGDKYSGWDTG